MAALLHGHRGEAGQRCERPVAGLHPDHVAEREHLRVPGEREIDASGAVEVEARLVRELRC